MLALCQMCALLKWDLKEFCKWLFRALISLAFVPVCGGHLTAGLSVKQIFSHAKHGDANYNNKEDCDWIIEAPQGKNVLLNFLSFEMEDEQDCGYDFIEVRVVCWRVGLRFEWLQTIRVCSNLGKWIARNLFFVWSLRLSEQIVLNYKCWGNWSSLLESAN